MSSKPIKPLPRPEEQPTIRVAEFAEAAPCGINSVYALIHSGELPVIRIGRKMLIPTSAARRFLALD
jgi:excisionase family DNA binding protein